MLTIDQNGRIYAPLSSPPAEANPRPAGRGHVPEPSTVDLSSSRTKVGSVTYSNPSQTTMAPGQPHAAAFSNDARELTPLSTHPKALMASRTFLDIAHFDDGASIVDAYA